MPQQTLAPPDFGAAHAFIVRLRREPGSDTWRVQIIDVHSGEATVLSITPDQGDDTVMPFATALAAAIERLLGS